MGKIGDDEVPIEVALHFPHIRVAGHPSIVRLRLSNRSAAAQENIEITLDSRGLLAAAHCRFRRLAPGQLGTLMVEIEPAHAGQFIMQAGVRVDLAGERRAYRGTRPFSVRAAPENHIQISIGDIQSNSGSGANAGLGADYGNVQISNLLGGANIKTLDDLLAVELPEEFSPVPLELDYELSAHAIQHDAVARARPLNIPPAFLAFVQPGTYCVLKATGKDEQEIRLVNRPAFRIGRARAEADFVAWFWPRSTNHDERTMRISKVQVELRVGANGVAAWDAASANGTLFDGQPLGKAEAGAAILTRQAQLLLGHEFKLDAEHLPATSAEGPRIVNASRWQGPATTTPALTGCLQFTARETQPCPYSAVWLFTEAAFGTSASNALILADAGLAEIQGRFHHHRGCFWIENAEGNGAIAINGTRLSAGEIVPLVTGAQVQIGADSFRVEVRP